MQRLLIEAGSAIARELYLGIVLDRASSQVVFMASQAGGMEIEEVAAQYPGCDLQGVHRSCHWISAVPGAKLAFKLGLEPTQVGEAVKFMMGLYKAFMDTDSSLMEINPFITTKDGKLVALDCKINFDDNALFRHKDLKELRDLSEEDPLEVEASKFALNYIKLDGNIACMVNGAGLAMATMDIIQYAGGSPGELPRRRRRSQPGADRECLRHPAQRPACEGDLHQHLRRHSARGCARDCGCRCGQEARMCSFRLC